MTAERLSSTCPYCGEEVEILVDDGGGDHQGYVEDCPVCCSPWHVDVSREFDGEWAVLLRTLDD